MLMEAATVDIIVEDGEYDEGKRLMLNC